MFGGKDNVGADYQEDWRIGLQYTTVARIIIVTNVIVFVLHATHYQACHSVAAHDRTKTVVIRSIDRSINLNKDYSLGPILLILL